MQQYKLNVRFRDLDAYNHVNNAVYLTYIEEARIAWLNGAGVRVLMSTKFSTIIAHIDIDYRASAGLGDEIVIETSLSRIGNSSFDFTYRVMRGPTLLADAHSTQVCYDFEHGRVSRVPAEWKRMIETYDRASS